MTCASTTPSSSFTLRALLSLGMVLFMNACLVAAPRSVAAHGEPKGDEKSAKRAATNERKQSFLKP